MKVTCSLLFLISLFFNCSGQSYDTIQAEIKAIENGLMKSIQIKGDAPQTFNILDRMDYYNVPGISIAVVENGRIRWAKGYGVANTKTGTKVDENTLFQAGSISKPVAALAALKLYENGLIDLDVDVNKYLKGWQVPKSKYTEIEKVSMKRLLSHTAGMTVHGFPGYQQKDDFPDIITVLDGEGNTPGIVVDTVPGSIWRYSGGGYTVMEKVVEDVSGMPLEEYMAEHILLPMKMKNSTYQQPIAKEWQSNISAAYDGDGKRIKGLWNNYPEQAAAGLWTTPSDLALYCLEIQQIVQGEEGVLSGRTVDMMLTKHQNDWGLGPSLSGQDEALVFSHSGKNAGFTNSMKAYAYKGRALIVMTNADNGGQLINEIENAIYAYYDWSINESRVIELIDLEDSALSQFVGKYEFREQSMTLDLQKKDKGLFLTNTPIGDLYLLPMTKTKFIHIDSGTVIDFIIDKKIKGFMVNETIKIYKL